MRLHFYKKFKFNGYALLEARSSRIVHSDSGVWCDDPWIITLHFCCLLPSIQ